MQFSYKTKLKIHTGWINKAVFNHENTLLATASSDNTVKILSCDRNERKSAHKVLKTLNHHSLPVNDLIFSERYPLLVSGSDDKRILCYDLVLNRNVRDLFGNNTSIRCLDCRDDLIIAGDRSNVQLYDLRVSECIENINFGEILNGIKFLNENQVIAGTNSIYFIDFRKINHKNIQQNRIIENEEKITEENKFEVQSDENDSRQIKTPRDPLNIKNKDKGFSHVSNQSNSENYEVDLTFNVDKFDLNQFDINSITFDCKTLGILVSSRDKIVKMSKRADYQAVDVKEIQSKRLNICGAVQHDESVIFISEDSVFYVKDFNENFIEDSRKLIFGKLNDKLNGLAIKDDELMVYGKDLHFFYRRGA